MIAKIAKIKVIFFIFVSIKKQNCSIIMKKNEKAIASTFLPECQEFAGIRSFCRQLKLRYLFDEFVHRHVWSDAEAGEGEIVFDGVVGGEFRVSVCDFDRCF